MQCKYRAALGIIRAEEDMMNDFTRRHFFQLSAGIGAVAAASMASSASAAGAPLVLPPRAVGFKVGMVTYNMGKDMPLPELIAFCEATGMEGVELRTTHAHGVEVELSKAERDEVRKRFADSPVALAGLGSAFEYHAPSERAVRRQVEDSKVYAQLAADVGASGIKLRPNGLHPNEEEAVTVARIAAAWREVAAAAADVGVKTWMEVHGGGTKEPRVMRAILDAADHPNALICWNSNSDDMDENGSIEANFNLLKHAIGEVHMRDIGVPDYPWLDLFRLLAGIDYQGFCLAEIAHNPEPERVMKYYRTLFDLYTGCCVGS
jgi:sugar phosphate isomerase/epimerase